MNSIATRIRRIITSVALMAVMTLSLSTASLSEQGAGGGPLPVPKFQVVAIDGTTISASGFSIQADGTIQLSNPAVTWTNGYSYSSTSAVLNLDGTIVFSDGTTGQI